MLCSFCATSGQAVPLSRVLPWPALALLVVLGVGWFGGWGGWGGGGGGVVGVGGWFGCWGGVGDWGGWCLDAWTQTVNARVVDGLGRASFGKVTTTIVLVLFMGGCLHKHLCLTVSMPGAV